MQLSAKALPDPGALDGHREALITSLRLAEEQFRHSPQALAVRAHDLLAVLYTHWQVQGNPAAILDRLLVERYGIEDGSPSSAPR